MNMIPFGGELGFGGQPVFPKVDIRETTKDVVVLVDIPGVDPKNICVEISANAVKLSGTISKEHESKGDGYYRKERMSQSFSRVVPLPCPVSDKNAKAQVKNGMLTITLAKKNPEQPLMKKIPVEEA